MKPLNRSGPAEHLNIKIPTSLMEDLNLLAQVHGKNKSQLIREVLEKARKVLPQPKDQR